MLFVFIFLRWRGGRKIFARYESAVTEIEPRESEGRLFNKIGYDIGYDRLNILPSRKEGDSYHRSNAAISVGSCC
jgi:hypothetical protein